MNRVTIHVATKDRHSEVALLLQSLRTQTYTHWDIMILDDASGTPLKTHNPTMALLQRIKFEGHKVKMLRNDFSNGVCGARNKLIDKDTYNNEFVCRLDDDVVIEPDYLERLLEVINGGFDMATGVVPLVMQPEFERDPEVLGDIICEHKLNKKGELIERKDELAFCYLNKAGNIFPCHQFRTNCLYKSEIQKKVRYPTNLTKVGFREELWFSFKAIIEGYKIGCDIQAKTYHFQTPSGGVRTPDYAQCVALDEETTNKQIKKWFKKHGDFLK